jgi:glycosyltransferase involved in cell wall biosynthesis
MKTMPLISICIPTYNGGNFFRDTLDSIEPYLSAKVELVISDDCSQDKTYIYSEELKKKNCFVSVYRNDKNLGMDRNFTRVAQLATGKYVWFCGQDDRLGKEIIDKICLILEFNDLSILNVNFSQYDHDFVICKNPSFFARTSFKEFLHLRDQKLIIFKTPEEYFRVFTQPPSFLPAVIMRREYWDDKVPMEFYGTYFVQLGVLLSNMHRGDIGAFTQPLIKGRVPDDQWQSDGVKLFNILCGDLKAKKIAFSKNNNLPKLIYYRDLFRFAANYPFFLNHCRSRGLNQIRHCLFVLKSIYGSGVIYWFFLLPLTTMPPLMLRYLLWPLSIVKKLLFRLDIFERLRG